MSKRTLRNLVISLVVFLAVGGGVAFAFGNILQDTQTLEQQIEALVAQTEQGSAMAQLQKVAQGSETERAELQSYFLLRESDSISFLSEIESIAPGLGIDLETTGLQKVQEDSKTWVQTTFSIEGNRGAIGNFVNVLENIPYVSRVMSVDMSGERSNTWRADIVVQVQLLSYDQ